MALFLENQQKVCLCFAERSTRDACLRAPSRVLYTLNRSSGVSMSSIEGVGEIASIYKYLYFTIWIQLSICQA